MDRAQWVKFHVVQYISQSHKRQCQELLADPSSGEQCFISDNRDQESFVPVMCKL